MTIDPECGIDTAILTLTQSNDNDSEGDDFQFQIRRVTSSWTEGNNGCGGGSNGLSWSSRDGSNTWATVGGDYAATVYATETGGANDPEGTTYSMDITTLVNEWIDGTYNNYGFVVVPSSDPNPGPNFDWFSFWSDDANDASKRPKIEITLGCAYASDYVLEIDTTTLPAGNPYLTTDNVETANFMGLGEVDCGNNFGFDLSNNPPIAVDDSDTTEMNVPISVIVLDDDFDIDGDNIDLQAMIVSSPSQGGFVSINDNGTPGDLTDDFLNYTPPVNYAGKDTLTYAICDDGAPSLCDTADVIITILALTNDPPVAVDDIAITEQDEMICIDVLINDSDPEGDTINPPTSAGRSDTFQVYSSSGTVGGIADALDSINGSGAIFNSIGDSLILDFGSIVPSGNMVKLETFGLNSQGSIRTIRLEQLSNDQTTVSNALDISHCCSAAGLAIKNTNYILDADTRYLLITMPLREGGRIEVDYVDIIYITRDVNSSSKGGNVTIIPGGIICYTPPGGFTGNDDFDYIICDPSGLCDKGKVVINVTPPTNTPPTLFPDVAQACTNQAEIINVVVNDTDSDGNIDPTSVSIFSTPSNGTAVSNGDGTVTYTSNMAFTGLDSFQYQVCDDGTPLPVECSITSVVVNVSSLNTAPIALSDTASTILNQVYYINVLENDSDDEGNNLTVTINAAPANGSAVVLGNGLIEYTPNPDYTGPDSFTYNVCDDDCPTQCTNGVLVLVDVENQPPVAIDDYEETGMNTSIDLCVLDNDIEPDGNTILLFSMGQDASDNMTLQGGVLSRNNNGTPIDSSDDKVFYTPPMGYTGLDTFYYRICDDVIPGACDTAQVIINITPPIDLEVEKTVNAGIPVIGNNYTFKIKVTNNSATDGTGIFIRDNLLNELTYVSDDGGGFYDSNSGIWNVGTLNSGASDSLEITATLNTYFANNIAEVSAADQFDIDSSPDNDDGDQSEDDESAASLQINLPPVADNDTTMTTEDTPVVINVLFDDSDPDGLLVGDSVRILTSPTMGVAIDNGDSTVTYTPSPNTFGVDSFEYEICDVGIPSLCDTAWVIITVDPVNDPPVAVNDTTITDEGIPVAINVLLNDSDPDGDLIGDSIRVLTGPMNGDTSMVGDSLLTYTPAVNFAGIDSLQYEVCDTSALGSLCDTAWVFISVYPGRDTIIVPPGDTCLNAMTYELPEVERVEVCGTDDDIEINNFMDTDSCLTLVSNNPINGALDTVCVVLCDTIGGIEFCDTTVIIVETPMNLPPIADDENVNTLEETAVIIPITEGDIDPDGMLDSLSIALVDSTSNGETLITPLGNITYTPNNGFNGMDTLTYGICDDGNPVLCILLGT